MPIKKRFELKTATDHRKRVAQTLDIRLVKENSHQIILEKIPRNIGGPAGI
jgi:hypothetical protein